MSIYSDFYKPVADLIDSAQRRGSNITGYVDQMLIDLGDSKINSEDIDRQRLESQINTTYNILNTMHYEYTSVVKNFVFKLQQYTEDSYGSVNDFLRDDGVQVKTIFADISKVVGFSIDADNIEGYSS